jgi:uncharacterized membrane protein YedE/YeeE
MTARLLAFVAGVVFAFGLGVSGMTRPVKVINFLDFFGDWDPSLAFVMVGAIAVYAAAWQLVRRRAGSPLRMPGWDAVDARLIFGSAIFGVGWGVSGFCPGPAIVALVTLAPSVVLFVMAMSAGMLAFHAFDRRLREP